MDVAGADLDSKRALLADLERRECEISRLRRRLHERLDAFPNEPTRRMERQVSTERRELHRQIDALRAEIKTASPEGEDPPAPSRDERSRAERTGASRRSAAVAVAPPAVGV
jgi:hypothetical protein